MNTKLFILLSVASVTILGGCKHRTVRPVLPPPVPPVIIHDHEAPRPPDVRVYEHRHETRDPDVVIIDGRPAPGHRPPPPAQQREYPAPARNEKRPPEHARPVGSPGHPGKHYGWDKQEQRSTPPGHRPADDGKPIVNRDNRYDERDRNGKRPPVAPANSRPRPPRQEPATANNGKRPGNNGSAHQQQNNGNRGGDQRPSQQDQRKAAQDKSRDHAKGKGKDQGNDEDNGKQEREEEQSQERRRY